MKAAALLLGRTVTRVPPRAAALRPHVRSLPRFGPAGCSSCGARQPFKEASQHDVRPVPTTSLHKQRPGHPQNMSHLVRSTRYLSSQPALPGLTAQPRTQSPPARPAAARAPQTWPGRAGPWGRTCRTPCSPRQSAPCLRVCVARCCLGEGGEKGCARAAFPLQNTRVWSMHSAHPVRNGVGSACIRACLPPLTLRRLRCKPYPHPQLPCSMVASADHTAPPKEDQRRRREDQIMRAATDHSPSPTALQP